MLLLFPSLSLSLFPLNFLTKVKVRRTPKKYVARTAQHSSAIQRGTWRAELAESRVEESKSGARSAERGAAERWRWWLVLLVAGGARGHARGRVSGVGWWGVVIVIVIVITAAVM